MFCKEPVPPPRSKAVSTPWPTHAKLPTVQLPLTGITYDTELISQACARLVENNIQSKVENINIARLGFQKWLKNSLFVCKLGPCPKTLLVLFTTGLITQSVFRLLLLH